MNPFTDETRTPVWDVGVPDLVDQLRTPTSLNWLKHEAKPADVSLGTFLLKSALDQYLIAEIIAGRYRHVTTTLVGLGYAPLTVVSAADSRQAGHHGGTR